MAARRGRGRGAGLRSSGDGWVRYPVAVNPFITTLVARGETSLGLDALAAISGVPRTLLEGALRGRLEGWTTAEESRLVRSLGVDAVDALEANPWGLDVLAFLRDRWGGLLTGDLVAVQRSLSQARFLCREEVLRPARIGKPVRPPPKQAWKAGYALAQRLRRELGWGSAPLPPLRPLVEDRLGIWLALVDLETPGLEALAVAQGPAMVIVLRGNPPLPAALERRSIAHELCHLLFDPRAEGRIGDAILDLQDETRGEAEPREQRARAFAAELLLPSTALRSAWGAPTEDPVRARERVRDLCARFGAPWELAVHHLQNHGHLSPALRDLLLRGRAESVEAPARGGSPALAKLRARVAEGELSGGRVRDLFGPAALDEAD